MKKSIQALYLQGYQSSTAKDMDSTAPEPTTHVSLQLVNEALPDNQFLQFLFPSPPITISHIWSWEGTLLLASSETL